MSDLLKNIIQEAGELKDEIEEKQKRFEILKNNIKNISSQSYSEKSDDLESKNYKCIIAKTLNINYDYDKLKKVLDKNTFKNIVTKKYELFDVQGFLKLLKKYNVPVEEVKKHLISTSFIDKEKVQDAFDKEEFSLSDISNCYTAEMKRVVRILRKK